MKSFNSSFEKIIRDINSDMKDTGNVLNMLDDDYNFNFNIRDLNKFRKYRKIVIIGMGGSILGSEAIYYLLKKR